MSIYEHDADNSGRYPFDVLANKSMRRYTHFRNKWEQAYIILTYRCPKQHPAWKSLNELLLQDQNSITNLRQALQKILLIRHQYPELFYQKFFYEFFDLITDMLVDLNGL